MSDTYVLTLPAHLLPLLEIEARQHGFGDVAQYVTALVTANAPAAAEAPALESALLDGLGSGAVREADDAFWSRVHARASAAAKPRPDA